MVDFKGFINDLTQTRSTKLQRVKQSTVTTNGVMKEEEHELWG